MKQQNMRFRNRNQSIGVKKRLGNQLKVVQGKPRGTVQDARQKIIQQKRKTVFDARDVLAKIAKTQDARSKILKIRETKKGDTFVNTSVRAIGHSILQKTDRNGKISLVTSKNKQTKNMNLAIQQQLGLVSQPRKKITTIKRSPAPVSLTTSKASTSFPSTAIRKTIVNDVKYHPSSIYDDYMRDYPSNEDLYRWPRPSTRITAASMMDTAYERPTKSMRIDHRPQPLERENWRPYIMTVNRPRPVHIPSAYIDLDEPEDEEMPMVASPQQKIAYQSMTRSSNVLSRLDKNLAPQQSHGIFSTTTKTKVVVPAGHRIVVSNLQSSVTEDDIRELFEDIGQLLVARLVRPGTAEVIYMNLKDAQKAVDTYHNRQLDGQPMKCLLVNKRPINNPTGPAINTMRPAPISVLSAKKPQPTAKSVEDKLVPDLSTIHKVLFQKN